jgi:hypothetical protein
LGVPGKRSDCWNPYGHYKKGGHFRVGGTYEALERRGYKIMMDILEDGKTLIN